MGNEHQAAAEKFWATKVVYPDYDQMRRRRFHDLNFIVPRIAEANTYLDIGCGEGGTAIAVREVSCVDMFYLLDCSQGFIDILKDKWGNSSSRLDAKVVDIIDPGVEFPNADVAVLFGVLLYVFDDEKLRNILRKISSDHVLIRCPCTLSEDPVKINTYSECLEGNYAAIYRTLSGLLAILNEVFVVDVVTRIWPDEMESKYGSRQFGFECRRR